MSYYVSAVKGSQRALVLGPYRHHGDALRAVTPASQVAIRVMRDACPFDTAWGTAHHKTSHRRLGKLNGAGAVKTEIDTDGYVVPGTEVWT